MSSLAVLVPGGSGQLGQDLSVVGTERRAAVRAPGSAELDITKPGAVLEAVSQLVDEARAEGRAPVVINAAAYTAVDAAEDDEQRAFAVNVDGPRVLAAVCASRRVPLLHVSTDYVFSGDGDAPYEPDGALGPRSAYGRTKAAGEDAVLGSGARSWIVRTAWVYGAGGGNFVKTMARLASEGVDPSVVDDQRGSPTWTVDLASGLLELASAVTGQDAPERRVLHCTGGGEATWYELARAVFEEVGADPGRVSPAATADHPRPAPRPAYSVLSNAAWREAGLTPLRPWREALAAFAADHRETLVGD